MIYNSKAETLEAGLGLSPERTAELDTHINKSFQVLLDSTAPFTTTDVVVMVAPPAVTAPEAFYMGWVARSVLAQHANAH